MGKFVAEGIHLVVEDSHLVAEDNHLVVEDNHLVDCNLRVYNNQHA